jgi:hypothetical protein
MIHCREYWSLLMVPSGFWENRNQKEAQCRQCPGLCMHCINFFCKVNTNMWGLCRWHCQVIDTERG